MIEGLFSSGALPALERMAAFTERRHQVILHNIANLSTPNFRPRDLSVRGFQEALGEAIDERRSRTGGSRGELRMSDREGLRFGRGFIEARARQTRDNILFHDRSDRSLEHQMQALAENTLAHNATLQLLKGKFDSLELAIRGRM